jgi:hypothetical protein
MKKITIILSVLFVFVGNLSAQTPNANAPKYGGWVFRNSAMGRIDHFKGGVKFPPTTITNPDGLKYTFSPILQTKLATMLAIFKEVCPKPFLHSITYNISPLKKINNAGTIPFQFNIGDYPFFYDAQGNLKPINPMSQLGSMYNGYCTIEINSYPFENASNNIHIYPFQMAHNYIEAVKGKDFYGIKTVQVIVPKIIIPNFGGQPNELINPFYNEFPDASKLPSLKWFRMVDRDEKKNLKILIEENVILTYNNQLPFITLTRLQFLELIELRIKQNKDEEIKSNSSMTKENGYTEKDFLNAENRVKEIDDQLALLNQIKNNFKSTHNEKALINPNYADLLRGLGMIYKYIYNKNDKSSRPSKNKYDFSDLFGTNQDLCYQMVYPDPNYYKNTTSSEIKTITLKWKYYTRLPENKYYGFNYEQEQAISKFNSFPSRMYADEPNSFMEGMLNRLDWKKLENLLTK